jgi:hypothetical protein
MDLANLLLVQALSSTFGLVVIGPHASEVISAGHSYFAGLRDLSKEKKFFNLVVKNDNNCTHMYKHTEGDISCFLSHIPYIRK